MFIMFETTKRHSIDITRWHYTSHIFIDVDGNSCQYQKHEYNEMLVYVNETAASKPKQVEGINGFWLAMLTRQYKLLSTRRND